MTWIRRLKTVRSVGLLALVAWSLGHPPAAAAQRPPARLDLSRSLTYYVAEGAAGSGYRPGDRALAGWALEAWGKQLDPAVHMVPGPEASATLRIYWTSAEAGLFGEMRRRTLDGRFAADLFVSADTDGLGAELARLSRTDPLFRDTIVYLTCVHELGHAFGLAHTGAFEDIMYTFGYGGDLTAYFMRFRERLESREDIPGTSPFSAADLDAFRALHAR